jgi:hypothetical protein
MPRFHFEAHGTERFPDPQGVVLKDLRAARVEAARLQGALRRDYPDVFAEPKSWRMRILDDTGQMLEERAFDDVDFKPGANDQ